MEKGKDVKNDLQHILDNIAEDIRTNGVNALYSEKQFINKGKIVVEIDEDMIPSIRYERHVCLPGSD